MDGYTCYESFAYRNKVQVTLINRHYNDIFVFLSFVVSEVPESTYTGHVAIGGQPKTLCFRKSYERLG